MAIDAEDQDQFRGDERLYDRKSAHPEGKDLKDEAQDHARDPQEPNRSPKEVAEEVDIETELLQALTRPPGAAPRRRWR